jgi:hypothetical protein
MTIIHARYAILGGEPAQEPIETEVWEPNPDKPGYLRFVRMKTISEVYDELKARLKADDLLPDEYFQISSGFRYGDEYGGKTPNKIPLPKNYWQIICFAVRGTSEGYYIHVGLILKDGQYQDLFLGKTLQEGEDGLNYALQIVSAVTKAFQS